MLCSMNAKISLIHAFHAIKTRNVDCRAVSCPVSFLRLSRVTQIEMRFAAIGRVNIAIQLQLQGSFTALSLKCFKGCESS